MELPEGENPSSSSEGAASTIRTVCGPLGMLLSREYTQRGHERGTVPCYILDGFDRSLPSLLPLLPQCCRANAPSNALYDNPNTQAQAQALCSPRLTGELPIPA